MLLILSNMFLNMCVDIGLHRFANMFVNMFVNVSVNDVCGYVYVLFLCVRVVLLFS